MDSKTPKMLEERSRTDSSLNAERQRTDHELASRELAVEEEADRVVEQAREQADSVLGAAREKADATLEAANVVGIPEDLAAARATEDEAVVEARDTADEKLDAERVEKKQAPSSPLSEERRETDDHLVFERAIADRSVASRDDFLAMVSHDVRELIAGMAMSADLLLTLPNEGAAGERTHDEARRIRRLTARMNRLVGDLLDVVSMESGRLIIDARPEDASRLLSEVLESTHRMAAARERRITSERPTGALVATFDHDRVLQVLSNLVANALKFTTPGGSIHLRLAPSEGGVWFTVEDDGCGIDANRLESIFERFSQGAEADRRGLGLGLFISRSIVEAHGGTIWVVSAPGQGSAFHFRLRRGPVEGARSEPQPP
jgi:signal transduction histidine kinase